MPSRRISIYLLIIASLIAALVTGRAMFLTIAILFGIVFVLGLVWAWLSVRWLTLSRRTRARRSQVGRTFRERFAVKNLSILPKLWLEIRDHSDLPGHLASHVVPGLTPRGNYQWEVETQCVVRGEFRLGPMTIISGDPFGFFLSPRRINATERLIVYPATVNINRFELPIGLLSGGEAQRHMTQHVTTNAAGVRDYVPGDSINRMHWKSTARRGRLIVKEFELDPMVDIWIFADFSSESLYEDSSVQRIGISGSIIPGSQAIPPSTEEYGVIIAASLAQHFIEIERALGFAAYSPRREIYQPERGHRQLTRIMESLAIARSTSDYSLKAMLSYETSTFTRGTTLVMITSSLDPAWISEVQTLARRGIRPMVVFIDPESFGYPGSSEEIQGMLQLAKIPTIIVRKGDDLSAALAQRPI